MITSRNEADIIPVLTASWWSRHPSRNKTWLSQCWLPTAQWETVAHLQEQSWCCPNVDCLTKEEQLTDHLCWCDSQPLAPPQLYWDSCVRASPSLPSPKCFTVMAPQRHIPPCFSHLYRYYFQAELLQQFIQILCCPQTGAGWKPFHGYVWAKLSFFCQLPPGYRSQIMHSRGRQQNEEMTLQQFFLTRRVELLHLELKSWWVVVCPNHVMNMKLDLWTLSKKQMAWRHVGCVSHYMKMSTIICWNGGDVFHVIL